MPTTRAPSFSPTSSVVTNPTDSPATNYYQDLKKAPRCFIQPCSQQITYSPKDLAITSTVVDLEAQASVISETKGTVDDAENRKKEVMKIWLTVIATWITLGVFVLTVLLCVKARDNANRRTRGAGSDVQV